MPGLEREACESPSRHAESVIQAASAESQSLSQAQTHDPSNSVISCVSAWASSLADGPTSLRREELSTALESQSDASGQLEGLRNLAKQLKARFGVRIDVHVLASWRGACVVTRARTVCICIYIYRYAYTHKCIHVCIYARAAQVMPCCPICVCVCCIIMRVQYKRKEFTYIRTCVCVHLYMCIFHTVETCIHICAFL